VKFNEGSLLLRQIEQSEKVNYITREFSSGVFAAKRPSVSAISASARGAFAVFGLVALLLPISSAIAQSQSSRALQPAAYRASSVIDSGFRRKFYGGFGFGVSQLEPDASSAAGFDVTEKVRSAAQLMLGFDISKWFSVEGHANTLGEAEVSPTGTIGYQTAGLSGLAYIGKGRQRYNRQGINAFGRIGVGMLNNTPSEGLPHIQVNSAHVLFGAGVEYATHMGLGIRAEAISFDTDMRYAQLSVLYRFGQGRERARDIVAATSSPQLNTEPDPQPLSPPEPAAAIAAVDSDDDGVSDDIDRCPNTQINIAVDQSGCELYSGVIEGVNFSSGSAVLTSNAQVTLSDVVATLNRYPDVILTIMAHTDGQGDAGKNKQLSKQRARSVAVYLVENGISTSRLKAFGFGETQPIDSNATADGRQRNRRVELQAGF